jgi:cytochrome c oxidase cbb3-type subunit 3
MKRSLVVIILALAAGLAIFGFRSTPQKMEVTVTVKSRFGFDKTVSMIMEVSKAHKFGHQGDHPISEVLTSKGYARPRTTVVEVCNPKWASIALEEDVRAGVFMPCGFLVHEETDGIYVTAMDTRVLSQMFNGDRMPEVGSEVWKVTRKVLDSVEAQ